MIHKLSGTSAVMLIVRLALGGVLIYSGLSKVHDQWRFAVTIANFRLLPAVANQLLAVILPWMEITVGLLLVCGIWLRACGLIGLLMFGAFSIAVISALVRGLDIECGCFGTDSRAGWRTLGVDALGLAASLLVTRWARPRTAIRQKTVLQANT